MKKVYRILLVLACFLPVCAFAQNTIKGKVTNSKDGSPLSGVTVTAGSGAAKVATATGADGEFSLVVAPGVKEITFSNIGFADIKEKINGRGIINISMITATKDLGEVVVVGYGTQRKATLTGSVSTLKGSELAITKNENTFNMLTGKIPGLRMTQQTSEPGAYANSFDIRGFGGNGGGPPLIVIDGVPRGGFERMDPNEIESISVLKDASAAVYGVSGANGVILVTTKKGANKDGKFEISYSFNQAWQQFLGMPQGVGAVDYMMLTNEKAKRAFDNNFVTNAPPVYTYDNIIPWIQGKFAAANWIDAAFNKISPEVQHNITVSGGTDKLSTFISLGYLKQDGLLKSNALDYDRWNLRSNINVKITNRLRAQVLLSGYSDEKNQPFQPLWNIFKYAWNSIPINQIYANNNPQYLNVMPDNVNPIAVIDPSQVGYVTSTEKNLQAQVSLEYDIPGIKGLRAKGMYSYGYIVDDNTSYSKLYNLYSYNANDSTYKASPVTATGLANPLLNRAYGNNISTLSQLSLTYANTFNRVHNVGALLVYEESHSKSDNIFAQRDMPIASNYLFGGATGGNDQGGANLNGVSELAARAVVGRVNYDYKGKYLAEFSFREDASNKFKPGANQWGFFPGYSVGWRISEEPFFKNNISSKVLNNLKIRASYSILGSTNSANAFQYTPGYNYPTVDPADQKVLGYMFNGQYINAVSARPLTNENFTWYKGHITNFGLDFTAINGKVDGTIEVYRRDLDGLPATRTQQLPGTAGITLPQENLDSRRTQGIELSLSYKSRIGHDVGFLLAGNVSYERDRNLHVTEGVQGNQYLQWRNGQTDRNTNLLWGTDYGGQYTNYSQIYSSTVNAGAGNNSALPGDYYMQDWNNDGVINKDDYHPIAIEDLPLINFGFNVSFTYKSFDITALFAGAAGVWTEYGEQLGEPLMYSRSALSKFLDSWHTTDPYANVYDPNTQWTSGKYPSMGYDYAQITNSTKGIINASYVRLKTLEIGYSLPNHSLQKAGIKNCRFYINSYNLLTITGLDDGVDPEHPGSFPGASFNDALGGYKYPLNRTFNVGANITF